MSLMGSCPCCWPLTVTSEACGSEGLCWMLVGCGEPSGKELETTATSMSRLEPAGWALVGEVGKTGWERKILDNTASLLMVVLKVPVLPSSALPSPGHAVLCGGEMYLCRGSASGEQNPSCPPVL